LIVASAAAITNFKRPSKLKSTLDHQPDAQLLLLLVMLLLLLTGPHLCLQGAAVILNLQAAAVGNAGCRQLPKPWQPPGQRARVQAEGPEQAARQPQHRWQEHHAPGGAAIVFAMGFL
jgi:hypothetical protein